MLGADGPDRSSDLVIRACRSAEKNDYISPGAVAMQNLMKWNDPVNSAKLVVREIGLKQYTPVSDELHFFVAVFSDKALNKAPEIELVRKMVSVALQVICQDMGDITMCLVEYGLVEAIYPWVPTSEIVTHVLAVLSRHYYSVTKRLLEWGVIDKIMETLQMELTEPRRVAVIRLAGALCEHRKFDGQIIPIACFLVGQLITMNVNDIDVKSVVMQALAVMLNRSEIVARRLIEMPEFGFLLNQMLEASDESSLGAGVCEFLGSVIHHSGVCNEGSITRIVAVLARYLSVKDSETDRLRIVDAIGSGSVNGDGYVGMCISSGIMDMLIAYMKQEMTYQTMSGVLSCLCSLFCAASYHQQNGFDQAGVLEFIATHGEDFIEECEDDLVKLFSVVIKTAVKFENAKWIEFMSNDGISRVLDRLKESPDAEIRYQADDIAAELDKLV